MSKLAAIRQFQTSPAAGGGIFSFLAPIAKFVGKGLGLIKPVASKAAQAAAQAARTPQGQAALAVGMGAATAALMKGGKGGGRGASGSFYPRRSRGITARELRGYRKVANLLHKEGMVSKRARGRKVC